MADISFCVLQLSILIPVLILDLLIKKKKCSLSVGNPDLKFPFSSFPQHFPVPEVPGGVGPGAAGRFCAGVQVWVPVAVLALHQERLRFLPIPGLGEWHSGSLCLSREILHSREYSMLHCWLNEMSEICLTGGEVSLICPFSLMDILSMASGNEVKIYQNFTTGKYCVSWVWISQDYI